LDEEALNNLRILAVGLASSAPAILFIAARPAASPAKPLASAERKVEQVEKNIKVLNGTPQAQLFPTMRFMSASLGVSCEYCHAAKDGNFDFASDEKESKRVARDMIKMTMVANKTTFGGKSEVSCFTCHQGQVTPKNLPGLPVPHLDAAGAPTAASPSPTPALPRADAIFNKYFVAIGADAAAGKIHSCAVHGSVVNASGSTGTYEAAQVIPGKVYETIITSRGRSARVINHNRAWEKTPYEIHPLEGLQLEDTSLALPLSATIGLRGNYVKAETTKMDQINDHQAYVVTATRTDGKRERLYFDAENNLLLRRISNTNTVIGVIQEETDYEDYREIEGVKLPTTIRVATVDSLNPTSTRKLESIELNVPIDDAKFAPPTADK
jgi:Photosynthetic reaction centre cytochrome C subunit